MPVTMEYNRQHALTYAERYALSPNPAFGNFAGIGGNCTNFVSQCIYAGTCQMNDTPTFGWYYRSLDDRAPAWTGVDAFFRFMTENEGVGPFGRECSLAETRPGDVIQIGREDKGGFYHSLFVVGQVGDDPLIAAQSDNYYRRALSTYDYEYLRCIRILAVRKVTEKRGECFDGIYGGNIPRV